MVKAVFEQLRGLTFLSMCSAVPRHRAAALRARRRRMDEGGEPQSAAAVRLDRALLPSMIAQGSGVIVQVTWIQHTLPLPE